MATRIDADRAGKNHDIISVPCAGSLLIREVDGAGTCTLAAWGEQSSCEHGEAENLATRVKPAALGGGLSEVASAIRLSRLEIAPGEQRTEGLRRANLDLEAQIQPRRLWPEQQERIGARV